MWPPKKIKFKKCLSQLTADSTWKNYEVKKNNGPYSKLYAKHL